MLRAVSKSFNRDSEDFPENRPGPILPGMSGEERVSVLHKFMEPIVR
jgi:hypothetical protein